MSEEITFEELDKVWMELSTCDSNMCSTREFASKWGVPKGTAHSRLQKLVDMGYARKSRRHRCGGGVEVVWGLA